MFFETLWGAFTIAIVNFIFSSVCLLKVKILDNYVHQFFFHFRIDCDHILSLVLDVKIYIFSNSTLFKCSKMEFGQIKI